MSAHELTLGEKTVVVGIDISPWLSSLGLITFPHWAADTLRALVPVLRFTVAGIPLCA